MKSLITGVAAASLLFCTAALAAEDMSKTQPPAASPNSGAGVKGATDSTNGPSSKSPDGANTGASTGDAGNSTQDTSGIKGAEDSTNGPSDKAPGAGSSK